MNEHKDTWANGANYEYYVGRWSRLVARKFVAWLDIPSGTRWLDVGCGTGILSQTILDVASPQTVVESTPLNVILIMQVSKYRNRMYLFV
jgi:2-polyprenyl-3-methyl-5-hydroxy-6-metoxy-1,4-benzoquinol methylase